MEAMIYNNIGPVFQLNKAGELIQKRMKAAKVCDGLYFSAPDRTQFVNLIIEFNGVKWIEHTVPAEKINTEHLTKRMPAILASIEAGRLNNLNDYHKELHRRIFNPEQPAIMELKQPERKKAAQQSDVAPNVDGTIRAKVIQYKRDGNTLTEKWETLTKHAEGIYYSYTKADKYGHRDINIIFAKNGVYWHKTGVPEYYFNSDSHGYSENMENLKRMYADYEADILQAAANGCWLNKLHITVMERLGHDVAPMLARYEERKRKWQENERKRIEAEERAERERKEAEERRKAELLADGKDKLMTNKPVTVEQIELLAEAVGYKIHIRTIGFMREKVSEAVLNADETVTVWRRKLTQRNISGTADVLREIAARIKAQIEKEAQQPATPTETHQIPTETAEVSNVSAESEKREEIVANCLYWDYQAQAIKERVNKLTKVTEHLYYIDGGGDYVTIARCLNGVFWEQQGNAEIHRSAFDPNGTEYETILKELCAYQTAEEFIAKEYTYRMENGWYIGEFTSEIVRRLTPSPEPIEKLEHLPQPPKYAPQPRFIHSLSKHITEAAKHCQGARKRRNSAIRKFRTTCYYTLRNTLRPVMYVPRQCFTANSPPIGSPR